MDSEHYIDGQHNGGVFNHFNHNSYGYCYQNPIMLVDPDGKQALPGAIAGFFAELIVTVGGILSENNFNISISDAFSQISEVQWWYIGISTGIGAAGGGVAQMLKTLSNPVTAKILGYLAETLLGTIENLLKQYIDIKDDKGQEIDIMGALYGALIEAGAGGFLEVIGVKSSAIDDAIDVSNKKIKDLNANIKNTKNSTSGTKKSRNKKIKKDKKELSSEKSIKNKLVILESGGKTINSVIQKNAGNIIKPNNENKSKKSKTNHPCKECNK